MQVPAFTSIHMVAPWTGPAAAIVPLKPSVVESSEVSFVTVIIKSAESERDPSDTFAVISYTLSEFESEGFSKSGALLKVTTPSIVMPKRLLSVPGQTAIFLALLWKEL